MVKKQTLLGKSIFSLLTGAVFIVLLNIIGQYKFERFDLTSEKRYTLSEASKNLAESLDDIVYVRIYLEGDFPAGFQRLRNATKEMLDEFRAYSNNNIEYEFINPSKSSDEKLRNKLYKELLKQGLQPTSLQLQEEGGSAQKIIFPGAIFSYKERQLPLQLLKNRMGSHPEEMLNISVQGLEYEIANVIRKLKTNFQPKVAFIEGHGELTPLEVQDISQTLAQYYRVQRVQLNEKVNALDGFTAAVIAKPTKSFNEKDKFIIDQFIMKGGKMLWLIDGMAASMDSLIQTSVAMAIPSEINLDDQLFRYGVRINMNLVQDLQAAAIPINTAVFGAAPKWDYFPWAFFPLIIPQEDHPVVKNLNAIKFKFASSIDTVSVKGVRKTVLLKSSEYSRVLSSPVKITLATITQQADEKQFNRPHQPVAYLLEGSFTSVFKNRLPKNITEDKSLGFLESSKPTSMIVISDGDVIRNEVQQSSGQAYPLGFDRFTGQEFGNKDFILNCIDFLCDDSDLIKVRSRELKLRLLDKTKIENDRLNWQLANTSIPIGIVLLFGLLMHVIRKRRYT